MTRIKLILSYDGTDFCGWQCQPDKRTVQQTVTDAIFSLTGEKVKVIGSGRTDGGVHALYQVAHFDTNSTIPPEKFYKALNTLLPHDVKAIDSQKVSPSFNARRSAKSKTYRYSLYHSDTEKPLKERFATRVYGNIDIDKMKTVASLFIGEHDFKAFMASGNSSKTTVRTIYNLDIDVSGEDIFITVTGNGFLYNMVRIITGTIVKVAKNEISIDNVLSMISGTKKRNLGGDTFPAKGLSLIEVKY